MPDWPLDFTTMDDTAVFTAAAAIDIDTPQALHIASFQVTPRQLSQFTEEVLQTPFHLVSLGSVDELHAQNARMRGEQPRGRKRTFPPLAAESVHGLHVFDPSQKAGQ